MKKIQTILMLLLLQQVAFAERFVLDKCIDLHEVIEYQEMPDTSLYVLGKSKHYATHAWDYNFDVNGNVLDSTWIAVQPNTFLEYEVYHFNKYDKNDNLLWSYTLDTQYAYKDFYEYDEDELNNSGYRATYFYYLASFQTIDDKIYITNFRLPHFNYIKKKGIYAYEGLNSALSTIITTKGVLIKKEEFLKNLVNINSLVEINNGYSLNYEHHTASPIFKYSNFQNYFTETNIRLVNYKYFMYNENDSLIELPFIQPYTFFINEKILLQYKASNLAIVNNHDDTLPLTYQENNITFNFDFGSKILISYVDTNHLLIELTDNHINLQKLYLCTMNTGHLEELDIDNTIFNTSVYCNYDDTYGYFNVIDNLPSMNHNQGVFNNLILQKFDDNWTISKFNGQEFIPVDTLNFSPNIIYQNEEILYLTYNHPNSVIDSIIIYEKGTEIYRGLLSYNDENGNNGQLVPFNSSYYFYYKPNPFQVIDNHIFSNYYSNVYYSLIDDTYSLLNEGIDKYYIGEYLPLRKKFLLWNNPNFKTNIASCNAGFFHITDKEAIVRVRAYYDYNKNGIIDAGEKPLSSYKLQYPNNGDDFTTYINDTNYYTVRIDTSLHHFTVSVSDTLFTVLVPTQSVYSQNYGSVDTLIYLVQPIKTVNDVAIKINRNGTSRPGFDNSYTIELENKGTTQIYISKLKLLYNPTLQLQPNISNYSFTKNGDSIIINFNQYLLPQEKYYLQFYFKVATSPIANIGDTIINSISIGSGYSDDNASNNYALLQDIIVGAYDPNDKQVDMPNYAIDDPMQVASQSLNYTIRFENNGNYYATHVFVHDTLPPGLNASTLQVIATSHPYTLSVINDSILEFQFWDIYLDYADASNKGFITYSVATQSDIALLQEPIRNKASIVFDYNLPIVTEYAVTTIQIPTPNPTDKTSKATLRLYPNPNNGYFHIDLQNLEVITHAYIIDSKGSTIPVTLQGNTIEVQQLSAGMYQLILLSEDTTWNVAFVKQ